MGITKNIEGVIKSFQKMTTNVNGVLKTMNSIHTNVNGVLKQVFGYPAFQVALTETSFNLNGSGSNVGTNVVGAYSPTVGMNINLDRTFTSSGSTGYNYVYRLYGVNDFSPATACKLTFSGGIVRDNISTQSGYYHVYINDAEKESGTYSVTPSDKIRFELQGNNRGGTMRIFLNMKLI